MLFICQGIQLINGGGKFYPSSQRSQSLSIAKTRGQPDDNVRLLLTESEFRSYIFGGESKTADPAGSSFELQHYYFNMLDELEANPETLPAARLLQFSALVSYHQSEVVKQLIAASSGASSDAETLAAYESAVEVLKRRHIVEGFRTGSRLQSRLTEGSFKAPSFHALSFQPRTWRILSKTLLARKGFSEYAERIIEAFIDASKEAIYTYDGPLEDRNPAIDFTQHIKTCSNLEVEPSESDSHYCAICGKRMASMEHKLAFASLAFAGKVYKRTGEHKFVYPLKIAFFGVRLSYRLTSKLPRGEAKNADDLRSLAQLRLAIFTYPERFTAIEKAVKTPKSQPGKASVREVWGSFI
jgi:hypothetical protein